MLDINKLRNAYNVIHRMSQNTIFGRGRTGCCRLYRQHGISSNWLYLWLDTGLYHFDCTGLWCASARGTKKIGRTCINTDSVNFGDIYGADGDILQIDTAKPANA